MILGASALPAADTFISTDSLTYSRREHTATLLPAGKILLAGGIGYNFTAQSELYDPVTRIWSVTGSLAKYRRNHSATLLPDGRVLVAGGFDDYGSPAQAELYDPDLGIWGAAGSLVNIRYSHSATLLSNGKVLIVGGRTTADDTGATYPTRVEIFDPVTVSWSSPGTFAGRANHTATLLQNGKVLVTGGYNGSYLSNSFLYDPTQGTWAATGGLTTARASHTATLLSNGKVLVTGGYNGSCLASTELYNPDTGMWSVSGTMAYARRNHTATPVAGDKILISGGSSSATTFPTVSEFYHPSTGTCSTGPTQVSSRELHTATLLPSGAVLLAGGSNTTFTAYLGSSELYDTPRVTIPISTLITGYHGTDWRNRHQYRQLSCDRTRGRLCTGH